MALRIATWNVNSLRVRLPHLEQWLNANAIDILAIQETKLTDDLFPIAACEALGFKASFSGQKTYNGVATLVRQPAQISDPVINIPGSSDHEKRVLAITAHNIRIINVYVPNGQSVGSEKYHYKLNWLAQLAAWVAEELKRYPRLIILGDFNIAPSDKDVHDPDRWRDQVLVSAPEREAFSKLIELGFYDGFRALQEEKVDFSWWDYRQGAFRRNWGLRIDHILVSESLIGACSACVIDRAPRGWERPSDHAPVILTLEESALTY